MGMWPSAPRTRTKPPPPRHKNSEEYESWHATKIIPGHGPLSNKTELKAYRDMLATVTARIRKMVKDGRKVEEIAASGVTAEFDAAWGKGFIAPARFAEMIAMNLIKSGP